MVQPGDHREVSGRGPPHPPDSGMRSSSQSGRPRSPVILRDDASVKMRVAATGLAPSDLLRRRGGARGNQPGDLKNYLSGSCGNRNAFFGG